MIVLPCIQGTLEWLIERLWRLTASEAKTNITNTGELSKSEAAMAAIDKLIAGIELAREMTRRIDEIDGMDDKALIKFMCHYTGEKFSGNIHTERGTDYESEAVAHLSEKIEMKLHDVGMCVMGDNAKTGVISCSPDALGYNSQRILTTGAEIKNPCYAKFLNIVASDKLPPDYKLQVHFSMAVCEVEQWHFAAHFKGKPIFHKLVHRDAYTDKVEKSLLGFIDLYRDRYNLIMDKLEAMEAESKNWKTLKNITPKKELII